MPRKRFSVATAAQRAAASAVLWAGLEAAHEPCPVCDGRVVRRDAKEPPKRYVERATCGAPECWRVWQARVAGAGAKTPKWGVDKQMRAPSEESFAGQVFADGPVGRGFFARLVGRPTTTRSLGGCSADWAVTRPDERGSGR